MQYITLLLPGNRNSLHQSLDYLRITLYTLTHIPILMLTNIQSHTSISFSCFHAIKIKVMSILQCLKSFRCTNISFLPCRTTETGDYSKKWYGGLFQMPFGQTAENLCKETNCYSNVITEFNCTWGYCVIATCQTQHYSPLAHSR